MTLYVLLGFVGWKYFLLMMVLLTSLVVIFINSEKFIFYFISFLICFKPIVDAFWNVYFSGISLTQIYSSVLILYGFLLVLKMRIDISQFELYLVPIVLLFYHLIIFSIFFTYGAYFFQAFDYFLRATAGLPFFFLMGYLLNKVRGYDKFLMFYILFTLPIVILGVFFFFFRNPSFYQITGPIEKFWRLKLFYHDATAYSWEVFPTFIFSSYLYLKRKNVIFLIIVFLSLVVLYACQTRTIWIAAAVLILYYTINSRKFLIILILTMLFLIFNLETVEKRWFYAGLEFDEPYGFSGRIVIWSDYMVIFNSLPIFSKLFGSLSYMRIGGDPHNQFIYWLVYDGIIGFVINLVSFGMVLFKSFIKRDIISLSLFIWTIVSSFSSIILSIPNASILLWSMVGYKIYKA